MSVKHVDNGDFERIASRESDSGINGNLEGTMQAAGEPLVQIFLSRFLDSTDLHLRWTVSTATRSGRPLNGRASDLHKRWAVQRDTDCVPRILGELHVELIAREVLMKAPHVKRSYFSSLLSRIE